jgi:hypothetical protein
MRLEAHHRHLRKNAMTNINFSTDSSSQRLRILSWLSTAPLTTLQARTELDIMHPAARVKELKERGYNIVTHWTTVWTDKAKHRIASYVLLSAAGL